MKSEKVLIKESVLRSFPDAALSSPRKTVAITIRPNTYSCLASCMQSGLLGEMEAGKLGPNFYHCMNADRLEKGNPIRYFSTLR